VTISSFLGLHWRCKEQGSLTLLVRIPLNEPPGIPAARHAVSLSGPATKMAFSVAARAQTAAPVLGARKAAVRPGKQAQLCAPGSNRRCRALTFNLCVVAVVARPVARKFSVHARSVLQSAAQWLQAHPASGRVAIADWHSARNAVLSQWLSAAAHDVGLVSSINDLQTIGRQAGAQPRSYLTAVCLQLSCWLALSPAACSTPSTARPCNQSVPFSPHVYVLLSM
jgi:hypothetical protein